jgi:hypothetical protein
MLLDLCEFCCAGAAYLSGTGLRCRRNGRLCFGAEGLQEPEVPHTENTSQARCPQGHDASRAGS